MTTFLLDITPNSDLLLTSDKIFSVLAVLLVIFGAVGVYLFSLNRKVKAIEEQLDSFEKKSRT